MNATEPKGVQLQTQEAGSGDWFTIAEYHPRSPEQTDRAEGMARSLQFLGFYARVVTATPVEGSPL